MILDHTYANFLADLATPIAQMNSVNPTFILRNYLAKVAIDKAEEPPNWGQAMNILCSS